MEFSERNILKEREKNEMLAYQTLETGIYVEGEILKFEKRELFDRLSASMPITFSDMPVSLASIKYPSGFRPHRILTNESLSVDFGFTLFEQKTEDIKELAKQVKRVIQREKQDCVFSDEGELAAIKGWYFSFRSRAMDSDLYNMMMHMKIEDNVLQAVCNCPYKDSDRWKLIVPQVWDSIEWERRL